MIGYPSGQDELLLPARHFLLWSRKKNVLLAMLVVSLLKFIVKSVSTSFGQ